MLKRVQVYQAEEIVVTFDPNLCAHSARCLSGTPAVFDAGRRKWIDATAASADDIARVIDPCPSGALGCRRPGVAPRTRPSPAPSAAVITLSTDGPLAIEGPVRVHTARGDVVREAERVALCRCGGTRNQPFCDGSHLSVGFESTI